MSSPNQGLRLSVSKTKTYLSCAKQYHFAYILKLPQKEFQYHTFGRAVHEVLELFHQYYLDGSTAPLHKNMSKAYKAGLSKYGGSLTDASKKELYSIIDKYLEKISTTNTAITNIKSVEKHFNFNITDKVILNGMIDRIQLDDDGIYHVCDYKTTKNDRYLKNDFLQLLTYAFALYQEQPDIKTVRGSYIMLRHNFKFITKEFSLEEILQMKQQYEDYAIKIENDNEWKANPTRLCAFCSYLDKCDEGKEYVKPQGSFGETSW